MQENWAKEVSQSPKNWDPEKARKDIPSIISVNPYNLLRVILQQIQYFMHKIHIIMLDITR